jgi:hypothetical protein
MDFFRETVVLLFVGSQYVYFDRLQRMLASMRELENKIQQEKYRHYTYNIPGTIST